MPRALASGSGREQRVEETADSAQPLGDAVRRAADHAGGLVRRLHHGVDEEGQQQPQQRLPQFRHRRLLRRPCRGRGTSAPILTDRVRLVTKGVTLGASQTTPYSRSPASPSPGTMYPSSLSLSSTAAVTTLTGTCRSSSSASSRAMPSGALSRQMAVMSSAPRSTRNRMAAASVPPVASIGSST